jgi:hypothetical protein
MQLQLYNYQSEIMFYSVNGKDHYVSVLVDPATLRRRPNHEPSEHVFMLPVADYYKLESALPAIGNTINLGTTEFKCHNMDKYSLYHYDEQLGPDAVSDICLSFMELCQITAAAKYVKLMDICFGLCPSITSHITDENIYVRWNNYELVFGPSPMALADELVTLIDRRNDGGDCHLHFNGALIWQLMSNVPNVANNETVDWFVRSDTYAGVIKLHPRDWLILYMVIVMLGIYVPDTVTFVKLLDQVSRLLD